MTWHEHIDRAAGGDFEDWFQLQILPRVQPAVTDLLDRVGALIEEMDAAANAAEGLHRDRWALFADHPVKSASSVRRKLASDLVALFADPANSASSAQRKLAADLAQLPAGPQNEGALRQMVLLLGDLGRFRVVCSLPRDVAAIRRRLVRFTSHRVGKVKDYVRDPALRKALLGHRAVQFTLETDVRVELQLMTSLQHAWDRRNHCFYEWLRADGRSATDAVDLRVDDHAVAEALHVSDQMADRNFGRFLALKRRRS